jgi:DNA topoisomerase III
MKTIIAEKPSVAKEIAHIVGAGKREEGYMQGNGYYVTWAFGHLVQPAMPETYGMKGFHAENLPVIPDPFVLVPRQVKTENGYKPDAGVLAQIKIIGKLFDSSERIIVATDAGREGELIFRYLYEYLGCKKPFDRLWISSLTDSPSVRDLPTSEMARSMTISIMQPRHEVRQTGSSASTARRP